MSELNSPNTIPFPKSDLQPWLSPRDTPADPPAQADADAGDASVADSLEGLGAKLTQGAHDAVDAVATRIGAAFGSVKGGVSTGSDTKDEWMAAARQAIQEHPIAAVATALLIGAAYVKLTASSPKDPD